MSTLSKQLEVHVPLAHVHKSPVELKLALVNEYYLSREKVLDQPYEGLTVPRNVKVESTLVKELQQFSIDYDLTLKLITSTLVNNFFGGE